MSAVQLSRPSLGELSGTQTAATDLTSVEQKGARLRTREHSVQTMRPNVCVPAKGKTGQYGAIRMPDKGTRITLTFSCAQDYRVLRKRLRGETLTAEEEHILRRARRRIGMLEVDEDRSNLGTSA